MKLQDFQSETKRQQVEAVNSLSAIDKFIDSLFASKSSPSGVVYKYNEVDLPKDMSHLQVKTVKDKYIRIPKGKQTLVINKRDLVVTAIPGTASIVSITKKQYQ